MDRITNFESCRQMLVQLSEITPINVQIYLKRDFLNYTIFIFSTLYKICLKLIKVFILSRELQLNSTVHRSKIMNLKFTQTA